MYRIIVVSDTHRHIEHIVRVLDNIREFDMLLFLGDVTADARCLEKLYSDKEFYAVRGNNDLPSPDMPLEQVFEKEGITFFMAHGHGYGVKSGIERIFYKGKEEGADVILFGHTHIPLCITEEETLILNPGGYNSLERSIGIVEIENGKAKGCLYPC
ncbi:MAG: metallophosphoesterase [Clostridia bacterium]|nr:metallophosphoesterase [Clostridia bacterium]